MLLFFFPPFFFLRSQGSHTSFMTMKTTTSKAIDSAPSYTSHFHRWRLCLTDMAASATTISARSFGLSWRVSPRKKLFEITDYIYRIPIRFSETTSERSFVIRALDPQRGSKEAEENSRKNECVFISQVRTSLWLGFSFLISVFFSSFDIEAKG